MRGRIHKEKQQKSKEGKMRKGKKKGQIMERKRKASL